MIVIILLVFKISIMCINFNVNGLLWVCYTYMVQKTSTYLLESFSSTKASFSIIQCIVFISFLLTVSWQDQLYQGQSGTGQRLSSVEKTLVCLASSCESLLQRVSKVSLCLYSIVRSVCTRAKWTAASFSGGNPLVFIMPDVDVCKNTNIQTHTRRLGFSRDLASVAC